MVAKKFYQKVLNSLATIEIFPERNSKLYLNNTVYRKVNIDKYIIIYQVLKIPKQVIILHIFHGNQNYLNLL